MTDNRITALYCRYSFDDGDSKEHSSISNQKSLLKNFADNNGLTNVRYYVDDGYTGTDFSRPDFQRMLEDVENNLIGTIIVKDMSRFGRNYIVVGQYIEIILPKKNVRVIGVNDNYDSVKKNNDLFQFENILNEMYAADISRKVRSAKKSIGLSGKTLKSRPVYGYKLNNGRKYEWVIDDAVAGIVYLVFDKFVNEEWSEYKIAKYLRENKVMSTSAYISSKQSNKEYPYTWSTEVIRRMLGMQEYCGDTVNFKTEKLSYKTNAVKKIPKDNWKIFYDTHPAIISREMFEKAQIRLNRKRKEFPKVTHKYDTFFRNKLYCSECGKRIYIYIPDGTGGVGYNCFQYIKYKVGNSHHVREETLRKRFQEQITKFKKAYLENPSEIEEKLGVGLIRKIKNDIKFSENRLEKLNGYMQALFESKISDEIDDSEFKTFSQNYSSEISEHQKLINENKEKLSKIEKNADKIFRNLKYIKETDFSEITSETCDKVIEKVDVGCYGKTINDYQELDYYIYGIGKIGDYVDIKAKSYTERLREILPEMLIEKNCTVAEATKRLGIGKGMLQVVLKRENTRFSDEVIAYKKKVIKKSIRNGLSLDEIYPLIGGKKYEDVCNFLFHHYNIGYKAMREKSDE